MILRVAMPVGGPALHTSPPRPGPRPMPGLPRQLRNGGPAAAEAAPSPRERLRQFIGLIIPLIWLFILSTRSVTTWMGETTGDSLGDLGSPADRNILMALMGVAILILLRRRAQTLRILAANKWVVALFGYIALSIIWSNFPDISFRRSLRSMGTLVMVLVVLTDARPLTAVKTLLLAGYCLHLPLSLIAIKYFRTIGVAWSYDGMQEEWTGLALHRNNLGQVVMTGVTFFTWHLLTFRQMRITAAVMLVLSAFLLRGSGTSYSTTAIVTSLAGLAVLLTLRGAKNHLVAARRFIFVGVAVLGAVCAIAYGVAGAADPGAVETALTAAGRDATLTGRTGLWRDILENAAAHPLIGVGFGAFWVGPIGYDLYPLTNWSNVTPGWRPNEGHNGYLDVYNELGLIGMVLTAIVILVALVRISRQLETNLPVASLRLALLVSILLNNITESSLLKGTHCLWFLFLLCALEVPGWAPPAPAVPRLR
jgi:exopolysaccharide production protein ExoQ